jgi:SAM-dependent methyltransferase
MDQDLNYWNKEYNKKKIPLYPSQFAAFVAAELFPHEKCIADIGCGNGRDSAFFASLGKKVTGIDGSEAVISENSSSIVPTNNNLRFELADFNEPLVSEIKLPANVSVYCRFFIHAINHEAETNLLNFLSEKLTYGARAFFEFRTEEDENLRKMADKHYRRFINVQKFRNRLAEYSFNITYEVQGFGYAKYKDEDAHVCRIVAQKA